MFAVGAMLGGGHEVPWDRPAAQRWFRAAAERGHPYGQMMLGRYLLRNLGGETNIEEARRWLERAATQGLQDAKAELAAMPPPPEPSGAEAGRSTAHAAGD
jgi:TPR repeat protein